MALVEMSQCLFALMLCRVSFDYKNELCAIWKDLLALEVVVDPDPNAEARWGCLLTHASCTHGHTPW